MHTLTDAALREVADGRGRDGGAGLQDGGHAPVSAEVAGGAGEALVVGRRLGHVALALVLAVDGDGDVGVGGGARAVRDAAARVALILLHRAPGRRGRVGRASVVEVRENTHHTRNTTASCTRLLWSGRVTDSA